MSRWSAVLLFMLQVGCSAAAPSVRDALGNQERCVHVPRLDVAKGARNEPFHSAPAGVKAVLVAATPVAPPVTPLAPPSAPPLVVLPGEGMGNSIPRGVLRLVPGGGAVAAGETSLVAGEVVVIGGAVIAAIGSGLLADEYYGTHFGDGMGWVQGQYPPPGASPKPKPNKNDKKRLGRIYVTYTKINKSAIRYYAGRTSMVVDLTKSLPLQAVLAVLLRDQNHHMDENVEPQDEEFTAAEVDRFDAGNAVDYSQRYGDVAYWRIRGREQQLIDSHGGARSDTGKSYKTENVVRGVAKDNLRGHRFHAAATKLWGQLHPYTGH